jgi:murein L,D-transpeptidase YcbB/YkuD
LLRTFLAATAVAALPTALTLAAGEGVPPAAPTAVRPVSATPDATVAPTGDSEIKTRLDAAGPLTIAGEPMHAALLRRFYQGHSYEAVWTTRQQQAAALWRVVLQAGDQSLDPDSFHVAAFAKAVSPIDKDLLLSDAFLAYIDALTRGMISVEQRSDDEILAPEPVDVVAALETAIASADPAAAVEALAPRSPQYAAMRRAYQSYEAIVKAGGWPHVPEGQTPDRIRLLQQRLAVEGYLPAGYTTNQLDETTVVGLRKFQEHHGLDPDGKLGATTVTELNVDADARARQIAVNLERLRWLPRTLPADRVWVNTASAQLELFRGNTPVFKTRVVVGETDKQTPEFQAQIVSLLYNPPWNIPYGIAQKEIMPNIEADPSYLERHHMTVRENGSIQQEAGPYSALGRLKFEMPNRYDVYLHDTPQRYLFARDNRRLSHGCVRVQNPRELGSLLMGIPEDEISKAINLGTTSRRNLPQPIPVFLVYQTAYYDEAGSIQFRRDVYQRDNDIWQHLNRKPQAPLAQRNTVNPRGG